MQRRENGKTYENIDQLAQSMLRAIGCVLAIYLVVFGLTFLIVIFHNKDIRENNQTATEFNALSLKERQLITHYLSDPEQEEHAESDYKMELQTETTSQAMVHFFKWMLLSCCIGLSLACLGFYWRKSRSDGYFLANFPYWQRSGWVVFFISLLTGWPFYLVSFVKLRCYDFDAYQAEKTALQQIAADELEREFQAQRVQSFGKKAHRQFLAYRVRNRAEGVNRAIENVQDQLRGCQNNLHNYGNDIQRIQNKIGGLNAQLRELQAVDCQPATTRALAEDEWQQIIQMRGVRQIYTDRKKSKQSAHSKRRSQNQLYIIIAVRLVYLDELYDLGDYKITLQDTRFSVTCCRSGQKVNATSSAPIYRCSGEFCFGPRRSEIHQYFQEGRIVEMLSLIIDSLHHVNPSEKCMIPKCFRKVKTIDQVKRQLKTKRRGTK